MFFEIIDLILIIVVIPFLLVCLYLYIEFFDSFKLFLKEMINSMVLKFQNISTNKNFIFINHFDLDIESKSRPGLHMKSISLKILKTDKTKEETEKNFYKKLSELNISNFEFNDYFLFVEKEKIKQLKKDKLLKQFEQNIQNEILNETYQLKNFKKLKQEIKKIIEKQNLEMKNNKIKTIIDRNNSTLKKSNLNQIDLENSIKEIKN